MGVLKKGHLIETGFVRLGGRLCGQTGPEDERKNY